MTVASFAAEIQALADDTGNSFTEANRVSLEAWASSACAIQAKLRVLAQEAQTLRSMWNNGASAAVTNLPANTTLSNPTDLPGTNSLVNADWTSLQTYINGMLENATDLSGSAVLDLMVKAAGIRVQG